MLRVEVDTSRFPLVLQTLRFGFSQAEMLAQLARYKPLLVQGRRYAIVVHHEPGVPPPDAQMRAVLGQWQKEHLDPIRRCNVCVGVVLPSFAHRGAMTALNWLFPPVTPQRACSSLLEAVDYCCEKLVEERIELSQPVVAYRNQLREQMGYGVG